MRRKERGKSQEDLAGCLSGGGMGLPDNGFRSVVRPNSATANGETEYRNIYIVAVRPNNSAKGKGETEHSKIYIVILRPNGVTSNTARIQQDLHCNSV